MQELRELQVNSKITNFELAHNKVAKTLLECNHRHQIKMKMDNRNKESCSRMLWSISVSQLRAGA